MSGRQIKIINKKSQQLGWVQWGGGCAEGPPLRTAGFLIRGAQILSSKKRQNLDPSDKFFKVVFFSKKINPSHFIFQRVLQKFEDSDSICLWGMQIKMECPGHTKTFKAVSHTFLFLVKPSQSSFHQKDGNSFF